MTVGYKEVLCCPEGHVDAGRWRWRVVKPNGAETLSSGTYDTKEEAETAIERTRYSALPPISSYVDVSVAAALSVSTEAVPPKGRKL